MTLSEVYFYMLIIFIQLFTLLIITTSEDLKQNKRYITYLKITLTLVFSGTIMELLDWNHLCPFQCILLTSSPFITLNLTKGTTCLFKKLFKKEPFQTIRRKLSDGIWVNNKGDIKQIDYYIFYSFVLSALPLIIIVGLFIILNNTMC